MATSFVTDQTPCGDFETITVSSTAIGITASKLTVNRAGGFFKRAVRAMVTVESNSLRFRIDGTAPTASVGHICAADNYFVIDGEQNVANLKMIRTGSDATVQVSIFYNL